MAYIFPAYSSLNVIDATPEGQVVFATFKSTENAIGTITLGVFTKGCKLVDLDTDKWYRNEGTVAAPSFVLQGTEAYSVVYAGKVTWTGSGVSKAATVTGVLSTDIVVASIQTAPTQAAYLKSVAPTTDTVTITLSAANTSNDAVIAYQVLRATA
jgi:hypothetical protein